MNFHDVGPLLAGKIEGGVALSLEHAGLACNKNSPHEQISRIVGRTGIKVTITNNSSQDEPRPRSVARLHPGKVR
jgi:hypothetical protein